MNEPAPSVPRKARTGECTITHFTSSHENPAKRSVDATTSLPTAQVHDNPLFFFFFFLGPPTNRIGGFRPRRLSGGCVWLRFFSAPKKKKNIHRHSHHQHTAVCVSRRLASSSLGDWWGVYLFRRILCVVSTFVIGCVVFVASAAASFIRPARRRRVFYFFFNSSLQHE